MAHTLNPSFREVEAVQSYVCEFEPGFRTAKAAQRNPFWGVCVGVAGKGVRGNLLSEHCT